MYYFFYNFLLLIFFFLIFPYGLIRYRKRFVKKLFSGIKERFGFLPANLKPGSIWFQAASVGEVKLLVPLIEKLKELYPGKKIIVSVTTTEGKKIASKELKADLIINAPLDFPWVIKKTFHRLAPSLLVLVESEFWPNMLRTARSLGVETVLINGRISSKSYRWYRLFPGFTAQVLSFVDLFSVRTRQDQERFCRLGVAPEKIAITGNLKYDLMAKNCFSSDQTLPRDPTIVAGSIRAGEENLIIDSFLAIKNKFPKIKLIIAPRYLEQVKKMKNMLNKQNLTVNLLSRRKALNLSDGEDGECLIVDTLGDLIKFYTLATVAIVGGSFIPGAGGHNILEPASIRKVVIFGPFMDNFSDIAEGLVKAGGAFQITGKQELIEKVLLLLNDQEKRNRMAEQSYLFFRSQQGALEKNLALMQGMLK